MDLKANFKLGQTNLSCSRCGTGEESQRHVLSCPTVMQGDTSLVTGISSYKDLLGKDPVRVETLGHKLNQNFDVFTIYHVIAVMLYLLLGQPSRVDDNNNNNKV